jgi:hypothetical protein
MYAVDDGLADGPNIFNIVVAVDHPPERLRRRAYVVTRRGEDDDR